MSFTSCGSARFNRHSCTVASLKLSAMIVYDVATKVLDNVIFSAQHRWPNLWHYICCFVQSGEAFTVEGNTHTQAREYQISNKNQLSLQVVSPNCCFLFEFDWCRLHVWCFHSVKDDTYLHLLSLNLLKISQTV